MATTVAAIQTALNTYIGDTGTNSVSAAERLSAISEATIWLQETLGNDHQNQTYELDYLDTVNYYKITSAVADLLEGADLRFKDQRDNYDPFTKKSPAELSVEIAEGNGENTYAIERRDNNAYLAINHVSKYGAVEVFNFDSVDENGTWVVDSTNSDATNLTADSYEFVQGSGSLNFDADVSQSGNNRITIYNEDGTERDWSQYENLATHTLQVYIPDVTYFSSVTVYWGSSSTAYWSATVTTDINGSSFVVGWNRIKIAWADATMTSTPDSSAIDYFRIDINYTGSQTDDTDFRVDDWKLIRPVKMVFHYISWYLGTDTTGATARLAYSATTDIPFYSGLYDQYNFPVAHKAAEILLYSMKDYNQAIAHGTEAAKSLARLLKTFPTSKRPETHSFKVFGVNFNRRSRRIRRF